MVHCSSSKSQMFAGSAADVDIFAVSHGFEMLHTVRVLMHASVRTGPPLEFYVGFKCFSDTLIEMNAISEKKIPLRREKRKNVFQSSKYLCKVVCLF